MLVDIIDALLGPAVSVSGLTAAKAQALADLLSAGAIDYARLVETRQTGTASTVVMDVVVEVGQQPKHDIRSEERLAVCFEVDDRTWPEVLALRPDFPRGLLHLNLRPREWPASLCLWDRPYNEVRIGWSPGGFVDLVRDWLSLSARGLLHPDDQPLEPLSSDFEGDLIIPHGVLAAAEKPVALMVQHLPQGEGRRPVYRVAAAPIAGADAAGEFIALFFVSAPRLHGVLRYLPETLADLVDLVSIEGFDLLELIRERLRALRGIAGIREAVPIALLGLPLKRASADEPERYDLLALPLDTTFRKLGVSLDLWGLHDKDLGLVLTPDASKRGDDVGVHFLNAVVTAGRDQFAKMNGLEPADARRVCAIGAGALGSQVLLNLARMGYPVDAIVDEDHLLPHNLARHGLTGRDLGRPKAIAVSDAIRDIVDQDPAPRPLATELTVPGPRGDQLLEAMKAADVILDMTASVAAARHLALDVAAATRRVSVFLNPSGTDLVLLGEDAARAATLDQLEMQYYWSLATDAALDGHLERPGRIRYARSCRDLSSTISQASIAVHAGIASEAIRRVAPLPTAAAAVWRLSPSSGTVARTEIDSRAMRHVQVGPWSVLISESLIAEVLAQRASRLPSETGGILMGSCDVARHRLYLVGQIPSPPDSEEWPTHYIRGSVGLAAKVGEVQRRTEGHLGYHGEWHSHPDGAACKPSGDDRTVYAWVADHMRASGYPPVVAIICERPEIYLMVDGHEASAPL